MKTILKKFALLIIIVTSCNTKIKKDDTIPTENSFDNSSERINLILDEPFLDPISNTVKFNSHIESTFHLNSISLWIEKETGWEKVDTHEFNEYDSELILNGDFEQYSFNLATFWDFWESDTTEVYYTKETGYLGSSQKISLEKTGEWGLLLSQTIEVKTGKEYEWNLRYKTSDTYSLWAKIVGQDVHGTKMLMTRELFPSTEKWQSKVINFFNEGYDTLIIQIFCNKVMDFWLDEMSFSEIISKAEDTSSTNSFEIELSKGDYRWYIEVVDEYGTVYGETKNLYIPH